MATVVGKDLTVLPRITCRNCGSIVEYRRSEIQTYSGKDISGGPDGRKWVICPECGREVTVDSW